MKENHSIHLTLKRIDNMHVAAAMFLDDYASATQENIHKLLIEVASKYQAIIDKYKMNPHEKIEEIANDFYDYQKWLATQKPPLVINNLKSIFHEDLGIDANTLEAYLLLYQANIQGIRKTSNKSFTDKIIEELSSSHNPLSIKDIAVRTGINYNTLRRKLREMAKKGLIKEPRKGFYHI